MCTVLPELELELENFFIVAVSYANTPLVLEESAYWYTYAHAAGE
jgi:hypothetical protein